MGLVCAACKTESSDEEEESSLLPCENVACNAMYHRKCIRQMLEMLGRFECTRCSSAEKDDMESFKPTQTEPSTWHGSSQIKKGYGIISDDDDDDDDDDEKKEEVVRKLNVETQPRDWKLVLESNARIQVEKKNPKREGSKSFQRYEKYKLAKTAKEYLALGGRREDFKFDMKRGFITDLDEKKRIEEEDVRDALDGFVPVALRGLKLVQSKTTWDDVGGLSDVCRILRDTLELPLRYPEFFRNAPIRLPAGVLLYGPPGCGKTLVAGAAAGQCGLNCLSVKGPELLDKYIGASEAAVRALFARAQAASPCVLFFDEFEATAPKRGSDGTGVTDRVVNQLLTFLDGVEDRTGVYVLAATSRPDMIDAALLRPGRLDTAVECGFPEPKERVSILHVVSRGYDLSSESSKRLEDIMLSSRTNGWSGADIKALLTTAHLTALRGNSGSIELKDIEHALTDVRPSVPLEERRRYARIYARFKGSRAADFPMTEAGDEGGLKQRTALK